MLFIINEWKSGQGVSFKILGYKRKRKEVVFRGFRVKEKFF